MKPALKPQPGVIGPTILTASGRYFNIVAPTPEMITPIDIARGLSNTCRYGGHTTSFYSVAQHCVLVSRLVPPRHAMAGLLHDAAEAYIGDVVSPLKQFLPEFKTIENKIERVIAKHFGVSFPWAPEVKYADYRALRFEREQLMPTRGDWKLDDYAPVEGTLMPLPPVEAAKEWAIRFLELQGAQ